MGIVLLASGLFIGGCSGDSETTTVVSADRTPPAVIETEPANRSQDVATNILISLTFNETLDAESVQPELLRLLENNTSVEGNISTSPNTITFTPTNPLSANTTYTLVLYQGITDSSGNAISADQNWSFSTGDIADVTPPTVQSVSPQDGANDIALNAILSVTFDESIDPTTLNSASFKLKEGATVLSAVVNVTGRSAALSPTSPLHEGTLYTAKVTTGVTDMAGNRLASGYSWSFTTLSTPDTTPPTVQRTDPQEGDEISYHNSRLSAVFSEEMDASTLTTATFTLENPAGAVAGQVSYANGTATFDVDAGRLAIRSPYKATVTNHVKDSSGLRMAVDHTWEFITLDGSWSTAELIEQDDAGNAGLPQVAVDGSGNAIAVWDQSDGTRNNIWSNHYDASSHSWSTVELIEQNTGDAMSSQVAVDGNGNAIAVWSQNDGRQFNIWSNRYDVSSHSWSTAELIEQDTGSANSPQVAVDGSGNAIAVWYQSDGTRYNIWSNRYDASSHSWSTAELIEQDNSGDAYNPKISVNASGNTIVVWYQHDGTRTNIWSNRYDASSHSWSTAELIEQDNAGNAYSPQVAVDGSENAIAVWSQSDGTRNNIWGNRYDASSHSWSTRELIEQDNAGSARDPQVSVDGSGNAIAVWRQSDGTRNNNIWGNRYDASSHSWSTAELIEQDNAGSTRSPQVAVDGSGNAIVVWYQFDGTRDNIWSNRYDASSHSWSTAELIEHDNAGNAKRPQIAIDDNGNAIAVWDEYDGTRTNIWSNRFE